MHNPYVNRMVVSEGGEEVEKFFAYGNFCGPGHPALISSEQGKARWVDLSALSPPIDDLDQACFLHDRCHQERYPDIELCDVAFRLLLETAMEKSMDERCDNLMYDMSSAMMARMTSRVTMPHPYSTPQPIAKASSVILSRGWRELTNKTDEFPDEGTCLFAPLSFGETGEADLMEGFEWLIKVGEFFRQVVDDPEGAAQLDVPQLVPLE